MVVDCLNRNFSWTGVRLPSPPLRSAQKYVGS